MMRKWIIPLAILMVVPALGAATPIVIVPPTPENLVEGHTVFTVLEQVNANATDREEFAAAVAVLVREVTKENIRERFPGVLWFNDQYLVDPYDNNVEIRDVRHPCTGAVLAVNMGDPDPRAGPIDGGPGMIQIATATYVESYLITDPNDRTWTVDKWLSPLGDFIWNAAIMGNELTRATPDDDTNCPPVSESEFPNPIPLPCVTGGTGNQGGVPYAPGPTGLSPGRCEDATYTTTNGNAISYNAVLYFRLEDLLIDAGIKDHSVPSTDVSGCHEPVEPEFDPNNWPCPAADDDAEGNSHPYNPFGDGLLCPICAGAGNHGGSDIPGPGTDDLHAMRSIDLYYGAAPTPLVRSFYLVDVVGSAAPYHCHDAATLCLFDSAPL